jgi:hypothetical protein
MLISRNPSVMIDWLFAVLRHAQDFFHLYGDVFITGEGL